MEKRRYYSGKAFITIIFFLTITSMALGSPDQPGDNSRLVELIMLEDKTEPFYPFNDFESELEVADQGEYLDYLNGQPGLLEKISTGLESTKIQWKLAKISHRLLYVPEIRKEYAALYESYCKTVITHILDKTKLKNPYRKIQTLLQEKPEISDGDGITAFLVHNIIKESFVTYVFSNPEGKKLQVELSGRSFDGTIGSYGSDIHMREDGEFEFKRNKYTIWQNSARNPYTALMVPAEETLHIALREYTERGIKESLIKKSAKTVKEVEAIVDDWISVEEAIVGGLVHALIPEVIDEYLENRIRDFVETDLEKKEKFDRYHHLKRGIGIVEQRGYMESIKMYMENPGKFKALLLS